MKRIDLFKLHDYTEDTSLRKCIVAFGLNLKDELAGLLKGHNKSPLVKDLMKNINISYSSAERLVYLKRHWYPLFFLEYLLRLNNKIDQRFLLQDKIDSLKTNQPPVKVYKAVKFLSLDFCKIVGAHTADGTLAKDNLIRITDGYESNINILKKWVDSVFDSDVKQRVITASATEWGIEIKSKLIGRYLNKVFDFPCGSKQYTTGEPLFIKDAGLEYRKAFALGAMTFEAGVGMRHQVDLCVVSKRFRDDISDVLKLCGLEHKKPSKASGGYWRLWSNTLTKDKARQWMSIFETRTDKWLLLKNFAEGYSSEVNSFEEALETLNLFYPKKSASKVCLKDILEVIRDNEVVYRYRLAELLCQKNNLKSYGGKWAHSLKHYLDILKMTNMIRIEKQDFGQKKSWGRIIREVYIFNDDVSEWRLPSLI